ncbi:hypothetical protein ACHAWF_015878, partial [Thalassiosira exigua]
GGGRGNSSSGGDNGKGIGIGIGNRKRAEPRPPRRGPSPESKDGNGLATAVHHAAAVRGNDDSNAEKEKGSQSSSIVPSASSIVLELLERTEKRRKSEKQMNSPGRHGNDDNDPSAAENENPSEMSVGKPVAAAATEGSNSKVAPPAGAPPPPQNPKSVVPKLMDIYDDLAQSSTPQTPVARMPPPPQAQMPTGVYYSGSYDSAASQGSDKGGHMRGSSAAMMRYARGGHLPPPPRHVGAAASRRPSKKMRTESDTEGASRKKGKTSNADPRWSKRFTWPDELHRDFVSAIFDVGLKHSSPSAIMEFMSPNPDVTSERVKSRLQKYRLNREKSRKEFMASYDSALEEFRKRQQQMQPGEQEDSDTGGSFSCGEAAALCTHATISDARIGGSGSSSREESQRSTPIAVPGPTSISNQNSEGAAVGALHMPLLTAQEKDGPLGQAFGHLIGVFQSLVQQLEDSRRYGYGYSDRTPSTRGQTSVRQAHHEPEPLSHQPQHHPPHQQVYNHSIQPVTVEQTAANTASVHSSEPSMHEVAECIPHAAHAFMLGPQSTVVQPQAHHGYATGTGGNPQQQPPTHPYPHAPANAPRQYTFVSTAAPIAQGKFFLRQEEELHHLQGNQPHAAPAPPPAYTHQQRVVVTATSHAPAGHHHQPHQKYYAPNHQYEIPTIVHDQQSGGQPAFVPTRAQPTQIATQPAARKSPNLAMHHPSAPKPRPVATQPQTFMNSATKEQYHGQQRTAPQPTQPPPAPTNSEDSAPVTSASSSDAVANPLASTGTSQAQKESTMMKQEMQGQMAFQNKMRALKQIELSKYGGKEQHHPRSSSYDASSGGEARSEDEGGTKQAAGAPNGAPRPNDDPNMEPSSISPVDHQTTETLDPSLIWNPEDDDQIFDFLMENN